jgi:hypothetical protein
VLGIYSNTLSLKKTNFNNPNGNESLDAHGMANYVENLMIAILCGIQGISFLLLNDHFPYNGSSTFALQ